jgi:carbohydrate diacid regulator
MPSVCSRCPQTAPASRSRRSRTSASSVARTRFTRSQLDLLSRENDFSALKQTLVAWCECGFNLVTTAQRLAIHRNTVIYRLDKISRLTARDVREPAVAIALYLACLIDD